MRDRILLIAASIAALGAVVGLVLVRAEAPASRPAPPAPDADTACALAPGRTQRVSVAVPGQGVRSALVHLPRQRRGRMVLVVALHGAYADGAFMERYSGLSPIADRKGFAVVYPDAAGPKWRIGADQDDGDVRFLDVLLDHVLAGGCFDAQRVAAVGVSNGAGMAARFACAGDDRLSGLVAVAGGYGSLPTCRARRPLSVLEIHGTADAVVPYRGTGQDRAGDVLSWIRTWGRLDGCGAAPRRTWQSARVLRLDWTACRDGTAVAHLRLVGGAHAWPGADRPDRGPQFGLSASEEAWAFLQNRRLAGW